MKFYRTQCYTQSGEAATRVILQKEYLQKFRKIRRKTTVLESLFQ